MNVHLILDGGKRKIGRKRKDKERRQKKTLYVRRLKRSFSVKSGSMW